MFGCSHEVSLVVVGVLGVVRAVPTERHISLAGSDNGSGSASSPFRHLQRCIDASASNDVCIIAPGVYDTDSDVAVIDRQDLDSVVIAGAGPGLTVLDGSVSGPTSWTRVTPGHQCVWESAPLPVGSRAPAQLLVADNHTSSLGLLTPARFPNARFSDDSVFRATGPNGSMLYSSKDSTFGELVDDGTHEPSLASSGLDVTGMVAVIPLGTMGSELQGVKVTKHTSGSNRFSYTASPGTSASLHPNIPYFFEGDCGLLDSEDEWCTTRDTEDGPWRLRVWLPGCADPNTVQFRVKRRQIALNVSRTAVTLLNLTLQATAFTADRSDLVLNSVQLNFPTASDRAAGLAGTSQLVLVRNLPNMGTFTMYNSRMEWADSGCPLDNLGTSPRILNSEFLRSGYAGGTCAVIGGTKLESLIFEQNTVFLFNSFTAVVPGPRSSIRLNRIGGQGAISDGALVHVHIGPQNGTVISRNWFHDAQVKAARFDRVNQPGANWGFNGTIIENVAFRTTGIMVKGNNHTVGNNTSFDTVDGGPSISVMEFDPTVKWSAKGENINTTFVNNAADEYFNVSGHLAGQNSGNYAGEIRMQLVSEDTEDFRPRPGTPLAQSKAGAYSANQNPYWVPGCQGTPIPVPPRTLQ